MVTFQAVTTSTGATVTDVQIVRQLCETYRFEAPNWEVDEEGEPIIWGYDAFEVYEARENGFPEYEGGLVTYGFLRKPVNYFEPDEEPDIQAVGCTKYRFPVPAKRSSVFG